MEKVILYIFPDLSIQWIKKAAGKTENIVDMPEKKGCHLSSKINLPLFPRPLTSGLKNVKSKKINTKFSFV